MGDNTYRIKPLVWTHDKGRICESWQAPAIEGSYSVSRWKEHNGPWRGWSWAFEDMLDCAPDMHNCRTAKEGKAAAEAHWRETLANYLEQADAEAVPRLAPEHAGALRRKAAHGGTPSYLRDAILAALAALGEPAP